MADSKFTIEIENLSQPAREGPVDPMQQQRMEERRQRAEEQRRRRQRQDEIREERIQQARQRQEVFMFNQRRKWRRQEQADERKAAADLQRQERRRQEIVRRFNREQLRSSREQRQIQRDFINDFFGAIGRSRAGYRLNRGIDFLNAIRGTGNQQTSTGFVQNIAGRGRRSAATDALGGATGGATASVAGQLLSSSDTTNDLLRSIWETSKTTAAQMGARVERLVTLVGAFSARNLAEQGAGLVRGAFNFIRGGLSRVLGLFRGRGQAAQSPITAELVRGTAERFARGNVIEGTVLNRIIRPAPNFTRRPPPRIGAPGAGVLSTRLAPAVTAVTRVAGLNPIVLGFGATLAAAAAQALAVAGTFAILEKSTASFARTVETIPGLLAITRAESRLTLLGARFRRAQQFGGSLSQLERSRTQRTLLGMQASDAIMARMLPLQIAMSEALNKILERVIPIADFVAGFTIDPIIGILTNLIEWLTRAGEFVFPALNGIWDQIAAANRGRRVKDAQDMATDNDILRGLMQFMNNPVQQGMTDEEKKKLKFEFNIPGFI